MSIMDFVIAYFKLPSIVITITFLLAVLLIQIVISIIIDAFEFSEAIDYVLILSLDLFASVWIALVAKIFVSPF